MEEVKKKQPISISEVKGILSKNNVDEMDQFQRWTFDYVTKFSVLEPNGAKKILKSRYNGARRVCIQTACQIWQR